MVKSLHIKKNIIILILQVFDLKLSLHNIIAHALTPCNAPWELRVLPDIDPHLVFLFCINAYSHVNVKHFCFLGCLYYMFLTFLSAERNIWLSNFSFSIFTLPNDRKQMLPTVVQSYIKNTNLRLVRKELVCLQDQSWTCLGFPRASLEPVNKSSFALKLLFLNLGNLHIQHLTSAQESNLTLA